MDTSNCLATKSIYLKSALLGLPSERALQQAAQVQTLAWGSPAWYQHWQDLLDLARKHFAQLIGAAPSEILLAPNPTVAFQALTTLLCPQDIVLTDLEAPRIGTHFAADVPVCIIPSTERLYVSLDHIRQNLQAGSLLIASRVLPTGITQDIGAIAALAQEQQALLCIDDSLGSGLLPLDVKAIPCNLLLASCARYLQGGSTLTFLYIREGALPQCNAAMMGSWGIFMASCLQTPYDFARLHQCAPSIYDLALACGGLETVLERSPGSICEHVQVLTRRLVQGLRQSFSSRRWTLPGDLLWDASRLFVLLQSHEAESLHTCLERHHVLSGLHPGHLSLAPGAYNDTADIDQVLDLLSALS